MEPIINRKARHEYTILETFVAGIVLTGPEVKSIKSGRCQFDGSFVRIRNGEAWLTGTTIPRYSKANDSQQNYASDRERKLLLTKKEITFLEGKIGAEGLTAVPLSVYSSKRLIKIQIALAKGKRSFDKRAAIKDREFKRRLNTRVR